MGVGARQVPFGRHAGTAHVETVRREDNGKVGGQQIHHWDGRVDATIIAPTLVKNMTTGETHSE